MSQTEEQRFYALTEERCGKEMADLCRKRGYSCSWHRKVGGILMWNGSLEKEGVPWRGYFADFHLLEQRNSPWPSSTLSTPMHAFPENAQEAIEAEHERLQAVAAHFRERQENGELIGVEADLATARDALEKQIRRTEEVVGEPLSKIKRVLKVWVSEAERAVRQEGEEDPVIPNFDALTVREWNEYMRTTAREGPQGIRNDAVLLWGMVTSASRAEGLERVLEDRLPRKGTPEVVVESTKAAVLHFYHEDVLEALKSARQLDKKRVLYEKNLFRILHDEKVMSADEVETMLDENRGSSARPVQADRYAEGVAPYIDEAENLAHAYALALSVRADDTLDRDAVTEYRKSEHKGDRTRIRGEWRKWGYLDTGPYTDQKLINLKRRVKKYAENGVFPTPPERG